MAKRARRSRFSAPRRAAGGSPGAICSGQAIRRSGATSVRSSIRSSAGPATGRSGSTASATSSACTASPGSRPSPSKARGLDFARLTLSDNARTRAVYPFAFALAIEYRLTGDALAIAIEVANPGHKRAPYACGLHPGFRWPFGAAGRAGALVQFAKNERPEVPELAPGGLVRASTRPVPLCGRNLPLSDALFELDALCFLDCASRSLAFIDASGASITMEYQSFQHAALWTRPHAPFLCLEAWTGYSDPDGFDGDLFDKPGMRVLEPGERARHEARYVFRPE